MLGLEDFMTIQALVKRGVYLGDIAEQLVVHPRVTPSSSERAARLHRSRGRSALERRALLPIRVGVEVRGLSAPTPETLEALGLTIPPSVLARADEIVQ